MKCSLVYAIFVDTNDLTVYAARYVNREFLRRVRTPPVRKENPKLEIATVLYEDDQLPKIALTYLDGHEQKIEPVGLGVVEIISEIEKVARWKGPGAMNPFHKTEKKK